jgi:hypothetical protein
MRVLAAILICGFFIANSNSSMMWQTTRDGYSSGNCQVQSNKLRVIIHPFFAEVEEEAEIAAVGNVWSGNDRTLEIVNEFSLSQATAIQSMLLWNEDKILKAKLKMKSDANAQYENVVDRQKIIVAPRDPALIEQISDDYYRCRIYPVALNGNRKIRVRYIVPLTVENTVPQFQIATIFTSGSQYQLNQIPLIVERAENYGGKCILKTNSANKNINYSSVYLLNVSELTRYVSWQVPERVELSIIPDNSTINKAWTAHVSSGPVKGYYSAIVMTVPEAVAELVDEQLNPTGIQLEMGLTIGKTIYLADVRSGSYQAFYCKSDTAWDGTIFWNGYNSKGDQVFTYKQTITPEKSGTSIAMVPLLWGLKYTLHEKKGALGSLYGFVDSKMSLLALESDALQSDLAATYKENGVPLLLPEDVIVDSTKLPATPKESLIFEMGTGVKVARCNIDKFFDVIGNDLDLKIVLSEIVNGLHIKLLDLSGRAIQQWSTNKITGNMITVKMNNRYSGTFIVQIQDGARILQKKVVLR